MRYPLVLEARSEVVGAVVVVVVADDCCSRHTGPMGNTHIERLVVAAATGNNVGHTYKDCTTCSCQGVVADGHHKDVVDADGTHLLDEGQRRWKSVETPRTRWVPRQKDSCYYLYTSSSSWDHDP